MPEVGALPRDAYGLEVRTGRDLITATYAYIGPDAPDASKRYAGNNLACSNCHLEAGIKKFGLPLFGLYNDFPQYSARSGGEISIEDRINSCMTRSLNGRSLPNDAPEMQAIVAYIKFLSSDVPPGQRLPGLDWAAVECRSLIVPQIRRAANPITCAFVPLATTSTDRACVAAYRVPILAMSYRRCGAGALSTMVRGWHASLISPISSTSTMPHGADYLNPQISVESAWDIAAFVLSHPRPHFAGTAHDFPNLLSKPVDTPCGPYADRFSERQHKYGPFGPIRAEIQRLQRDWRTIDRNF